MNTVHLRILAPERTFFDGVCASLTVPTIDGMYGVMAQHEDVVIAIVPGKLTLRGQNGDEEIDLRRAEEMAAASRAELDARHSEQEQALARARIARAVSRMHVKRDGK